MTELGIRKGTIVTSCLLLIGCLVAGQADVSAADELGLQVRRLVRQLDGDLLADREQAEQALIDLGPDALELLPTPSRNTSAEVKVRLERVRKAMESAQAEAAAQPSLVTLSGQMLLSEALAAMEKQTGNRLVDFRPRQRQQQTDPTVTTDFEETPFWTALDNLLDQAQLTVYNYSGEQGAVAFVARSEKESNRGSRAAYAGLFRFEGVKIEARRDLRNADNQALLLTMEVTWEPRISPVVIQIPLADIQISDEQGNRLAIDSRMSRFEVPVENAIPAAEIQIPLVLPNRSVREIASLSGAMTAVVPGRIETFEFKNLQDAKSVEQSRANVTVVLDQVRKNVDLYEISVRVRYADAENALDSHRGWIYNNQAHLLDGQGERIEDIGMQTFRQTQDEVGISYMFDCEQGLEGCKFVYKTPAMLVNLPVDYELTKIPLP